jgi:hypothetical protein
MRVAAARREQEMPRSIDLIVPAGQTHALLDRVMEIDGIISVRLDASPSLLPPGDVVHIIATTPATQELMRLVDGLADAGTSICAVTSEPQSIITPQHPHAIINDPNEATWEEIELTLADESNMTISGLVLMAMAGVIAAAGLRTGTLHVVIGAMLIAPGFEPITRISLGIVTRGTAWRDGMLDVIKGYAALVVAAAATSLVITATTDGPSPSYLMPGSLVSFWSTLSLPGVIVSVAAGTAGAVLISVNRSILTAGVMVALALIPAAALSGMALVAGAWDVAGMAAARWAVDVVCVAVLSSLVFMWKRQTVHKRDISRTRRSGG